MKAESSKSNNADFIVHESIIRKHSPFFEAAMGRNWKEAKERLVLLPDHEPIAFRLYLQWIYTHRLAITFKDEPPFDALIDGYILGDYLEDGDFRDAMTDAILEMVVDEGLPLSSIPRVYDNTSEKALLRCALIDLLVHHAESRTWISRARKERQFPDEALYDIIEKLADYKTEDCLPIRLVSLIANPCPYHEHQHGVCYRIKYVYELSVSKELPQEFQLR